MAAFLSYQPIDPDDVDSDMIWKIHINPLSGPNHGPTYDLTDEEMKQVIDDYFIIRERIEAGEL